MKIVLIYSMVVLCATLGALEGIDLHFAVDPQVDPADSLVYSTIRSWTQTDTLPSFRFVCGDVAKYPVSDSLLLVMLDSLDADYAVPTDYFFTDQPQDAGFELLMSNVDADSVTVMEKAIISGDSLRIGVFAILTPDLEVLNELDPSVDVRADVFATTARVATALDAVCDYVILLSGMGKYVDSHMVEGLPIDRVISIDYQATRDTKFNDGKTQFTSVLLSKRLVGRLRLIWENGELRDEWTYTRVK